MTKLLNARDLLENVRSADQESSQDTAGGEVVPTAGGRVFLGTFKPRARAAAALGSRAAAVKATAARSAAVRETAQRSAVVRPAASPAPEIGLSLPEVPATESPPVARPRAPQGTAGAAPMPAPPVASPAPPVVAPPGAPPAPGWAPLGRKHTVPLEAVRPEAAAKPAAPPAPAPAPAHLEPALERDLEAYVRAEPPDAHGDSRTIEMALPPELAASSPDFDDSRTLEIELPKASPLAQSTTVGKQAPVVAAEAGPAPRSISPSQPLRKAGTSSWSRSSEGAPGSEPTSPRGAPATRPAVPSTPPLESLGAETPAAAVVAPSSAPATPSRPKSAVADMFSWVTQKPAWAPESGSLEEVAALEAPAPPAAAPPTAPQATAVAAPATAKPQPIAKPVEARGAPPPSFVADEAPTSVDEPVALSSEETLVMLSYDEATPLKDLADSTGLTEWRVSLIVDRLKKRGVLESSDASDASGASGTNEPATTPSNSASPPSPAAASPVASKPVSPSPLVAATPAASQVAKPADAAVSASAGGSAVAPAGMAGGIKAAEGNGPESKAPATMPSGLAAFELGGLPRAADAEAPASDPAATSERVEAAPSSRPAQPPLAPGVEGTPPPSTAASTDAEELDEAVGLGDDEGDEPSEGSSEGSGSKEPADPASMLALFELKLSLMPSDERAKLAQTTDGDELYALAYDKDPAVIRAAWDNIHISVEHARFWAFHHRTAMGLERIGQRAELLKDPQTQRRLFRNPQVSEPLLRKILLSKRLIDIYKHTLDREASERTRQSARGLLRNKFSTTEPEDRVQLLWNTEGRALQQLSGLSIDSKTASLVCARPIVSMMLVQSFLRFSATPPSIISYLLKQPLVKRQIHLRNALLKHPNCPADAKRAF